MRAPDGTEVLVCADEAEWESWLADHHDRPRDVWLLIAKKGSSSVSVTIGDALGVALCYGWIDSHRKGHDADHYLQRYSPRRAGSPWSRRNVERAEALIEAGRMQAAGLAEVMAAGADGRWVGAYPSQRDADVPPDLVAALERNERAREVLDTRPERAVRRHLAAPEGDDTDGPCGSSPEGNRHPGMRCVRDPFQARAARPTNQLDPCRRQRG